MTPENQYTGVAPHVVERSLLRQSWRDLIYVHWRYDVDEVQRTLPPGLTVDTFDGHAWVGLIPFQLTLFVPGRRGGRPLSRFYETNVRTYVRDHMGRRGVWFYSLDADRLDAVIGARVGFGLPYMWSPTIVRRERYELEYRVQRRWPRTKQGNARVHVKIGEALRADEISQRDHFLSAQWTLFSNRSGLHYANVSHEPWPLQRASVLNLEPGLVEAAGLSTPAGDPYALYAKHVSVAVTRPRKV